MEPLTISSLSVIDYEAIVSKINSLEPFEINGDEEDILQSKEIYIYPSNNSREDTFHLKRFLRKTKATPPSLLTKYTLNLAYIFFLTCDGLILAQILGKPVFIPYLVYFGKIYLALSLFYLIASTLISLLYCKSYFSDRLKIHETGTFIVNLFLKHDIFITPADFFYDLKLWWVKVKGNWQFLPIAFVSILVERALTITSYQIVASIFIFKWALSLVKKNSQLPISVFFYHDYLILSYRSLYALILKAKTPNKFKLLYNFSALIFFSSLFGISYYFIKSSSVINERYLTEAADFKKKNMRGKLRILRLICFFSDSFPLDLRFLFTNGTLKLNPTDWTSWLFKSFSFSRFNASVKPQITDAAWKESAKNDLSNSLIIKDFYAGKHFTPHLSIIIVQGQLARTFNWPMWVFYVCTTRKSLKVGDEYVNNSLLYDLPANKKQYLTLSHDLASNIILGGLSSRNDHLEKFQLAESEIIEKEPSLSENLKHEVILKSSNGNEKIENFRVKVAKLPLIEKEIESLSEKLKENENELKVYKKIALRDFSEDSREAYLDVKVKRRGLILKQESLFKEKDVILEEWGRVWESEDKDLINTSIQNINRYLPNKKSHEILTHQGRKPEDIIELSQVQLYLNFLLDGSVSIVNPSTQLKTIVTSSEILKQTLSTRSNSFNEMMVKRMTLIDGVVGALTESVEGRKKINLTLNILKEAGRELSLDRFDNILISLNSSSPADLAFAEHEFKLILNSLSYQMKNELLVLYDIEI